MLALKRQRHNCKLHHANNVTSTLEVTIPVDFVDSMDLKEGDILHFEEERAKDGTKSLRLTLFEPNIAAAV